MMESINSRLIPTVDVDEELLVDLILTRLPVKSLMRLKCVCKAWKSIIERDSHFMDLHNAHSQSRLPCLFIVPSCRCGDPTTGCEVSFFSAELHCDDDDDDCDGGSIITGATIHRSGGGRRITSSHHMYQRLGPVRGLLCLVDNLYSVRIYNVGTGQAVTPWIRSAVDMMKGKGYDMPKFQFGFDPNTGKHKVVSIWNAPKGTPGVCEVLNVGVDTSWRIIDDVPPCIPELGGSACANGSAYWATNISDDHAVGCLKYLMAFDFGSEKFRVIEIPGFTDRGFHQILLEMDGCLAVRCGRGGRSGRGEDDTLKLWKFHDYNKEQEMNGTSSSSSTNQQTKEDWIEVTINLPHRVAQLDLEYTSLHPIPGKDLMILEINKPRRPWQASSDSGWHMKSASFYSYNMVNKTFSKFEMQGIEEIPVDCIMTTSAIFAESLFSAENIKPSYSKNKQLV